MYSLYVNQAAPYWHVSLDKIFLHMHSNASWDSVLHVELWPWPIYKTSYSYS